MNTKRNILILVIILSVVVIIGLFFAYQFFITDVRDIDISNSTTDRSSRNVLFPGSESLGGDKSTAIQRNAQIPVLRQISSGPSSGSVIFTNKENTVIRYVERATGHIYETTATSIEQNRISNTTIPRVQKSVWSKDGEMVILQYLDDNEVLKSFYGDVSKDTNILDGWFLSNNITDIAVREDNKIFYIQKIGNNSKGITSNFDGTNSKSIFSSTIYDWIPTWVGNSIGITTKSSNNIRGFLYKLSQGEYTKLFSTSGLLINVSPDGENVLLSVNRDTGTDLFIYNIKTSDTTRIPFTTLPEKCTWSDNFIIFCAAPYNEILGTVPDDWYKGAVSFSDDIWSYNLETDVSSLIYDAEAEGKLFDATYLNIDTEQKMLLFIDKKTLILWGLTL